MRRLLLLAVLALTVVPAQAASGPTLFLYKAGEHNLVCAVSGGESEPVTLLFADGVAFSEELARRLGSGLFPGEEPARAEALKQFHEALRDAHDIGVRGAAYISLDTVRRLSGLIDTIDVTETLGPVRLVNLNRALEARRGTAAIRDFYLNASPYRASDLPAGDDAMDRCRPSLDGSLRVLATHSEPVTLVGFLRGVPRPRDCAAAESAAPAAPPAPKAKAEPTPPIELPVAEGVEPPAETGGCGKALGWLVLVLAAAGLAGALWWRARARREEQATRTARMHLELPPVMNPEVPAPETSDAPIEALLAAEPDLEAPPAEPPTAVEPTPKETRLEAPQLHTPQSLAEEVIKLKNQLGQVTKALIKINQRLDSLAERVGGNGGDLAGRVAALESVAEQLRSREAAPVADRALFKRINEIELMVGQSLGEMGRQLEDTRRQLAKLEAEKG